MGLRVSNIKRNGICKEFTKEKEGLCINQRNGEENEVEALPFDCSPFQILFNCFMYNSGLSPVTGLNLFTTSKFFAPLTEVTQLTPVAPFATVPTFSYKNFLQ
ncbi:hypothetical protein QL285_010300 [Trifolium repens]|nr:hypothetical protein QL285_010300 [Trifolium repens]